MQPWMTAPATRAVVAALSGDGSEVRFVGGCVRDAVLGRPAKDIDIATPLPPEEVMRRLARAGIRAIPTGIEHGTVTAVADHRPFEITTLRHDVETFGRRAKVAFTDDWVADAARRDFTFNALSCAPDGTLHDPFGGVADLEAGRVRFVGRAEERIREDVLRLLRFFRFFAHFGRPPADAEALAACRALASLLPTLSAERVQAELFRLLAAPAPLPALRLMVEHGVMPHVLPEAGGLDRLAALVALEGEAPDPLRRLAALVEVDAAEAERLARALRLSNAQTERFVAMAARDDPPPSDDPQAQRRLLRRLGAEGYRDRVLLAWAANLSRGAATPADPGWAARLAAAEAWVPVEPPVKGADVVARGVPPGPEVGALLAALDRWWEENDYRPDRAACLARLDALLKEGREG